MFVATFELLMLRFESFKYIPPPDGEVFEVIAQVFMSMTVLFFQVPFHPLKHLQVDCGKDGATRQPQSFDRAEVYSVKNY